VVSDGPAPDPGISREVMAPRRVIAWAVLRVAASIAVVETLYYLLPFDRSSTAFVVAMLVIGLAVFIALVGFQVRAIIRSPFPGLRAIEALATSVPLFLALFAGSYFVMARLAASSFGAPLTRTDALYFTVTVFSTVGFGDITAKTQAARLVVTGQMIADLIILGLAIKVIVGAVKRGRQRQPQGRGGADPSRQIRR
jgi:voltage-gated potassium channel